MPRDGTWRMRTFDPSRRNHPKILEAQAEDPMAPDLHAVLVCPLSDDEGRFRANPLAIKAIGYAVDPNMPPERIERILRLLDRVRLIHLYETDGGEYGKLHDWHEWQRIDRPTPSMMPPPPNESCRCCRVKCSDYPSRFRRGTTEASTNPRGHIHEPSGAERKGKDRSTNVQASTSVGAEAPPAAFRGKGKKLDAGQNGMKQGAIDYYYGRLQKYTGAAEPEFPGGQAAAFFTRRILKGDTSDDFREATDLFFNERIREKSAANFSLFQRAYNAFLKEIIERHRGGKS